MDNPHGSLSMLRIPREEFLVDTIYHHHVALFIIASLWHRKEDETSLPLLGQDRLFPSQSPQSAIPPGSESLKQQSTIRHTRLLLIDTDDILVLHDMFQPNLLPSGVFRRCSPDDRVLELFRDFLVDGYQHKHEI